MKVILLEDIKGVGKKGQLLNTSDGHARNYLLPKKLAVEATKANMNELEQKQKSAATKKERDLEAARSLQNNISDKIVKIPVKVGDNGKLFGSVTNKEISDALEAQAGIQIDKKKIIVTEPIKTIGEKTVEVKLHPEITAKLTVHITDILA